MSQSLLSKLAFPLYGLVGCTYICTSMYHDSKQKLKKFRDGTLDEYDRKFRIHSEDDAVREGAYGNLPIYVATVMIWPICLPIKYIPSLVITMNKKE